MTTGLIAVLCRNSLTLTKRAVRSCLRQTIPIRILAIDNASQDGTAGWLRAEQQQDDRIWIMSMPLVSVARAWNTALKWAIEKQHTEILVLNNDAEILPETYRLLSAYADEYEAGMVTCISRRPGEDLSYNAGDWHARPHPDFSCFLLQVRAWEQTGLFDEEFEGAYYEDNDYHIRMHQAGQKAVCIDLPFLHHSASTLKGADQGERERIESNAARNRERFWEKWGCYPGTERYEEMFV